MSYIADLSNVQRLFFNFVSGRHQVFENRMEGQRPWHWTNDPILMKKFTNVFRIHDRGSQFLLKELLYDPKIVTYDEKVMRAILYRYTNKPEPWVRFKETFGRYPIISDLDNGHLEEFWSKDLEGSPFNPCYTIIVPLPKYHGLRKTTMVINHTLETLDHVLQGLLQVESLSQLYGLFKAIPGIGPFMAMQISTDIGYSDIFRDDWENEFISPGPGSIRGARLFDPGSNPVDTIYWVTRQLDKILHELHLPEVITRVGESGVRFPSLMDIQNCFCEFQKYHRIYSGNSRGTNFKQKSVNVPEIWYPGKWSMTTKSTSKKEGETDGSQSLVKRPSSRRF